VAGPLVSVIIPALNEAQQIQEAIAAARRGYAADEVEIIVVDGGSTDGTPELVSKDATLVVASRGRAVQMNHGARLAVGQVLLFCHADSQLPLGWREAILGALRRPGVAGGAFRPLLRPARGIMLHLLNIVPHPADWRILYGDAAQFMARATFDRLGGYPEQPLLEDVEMARALHRAGRLVRLPLRVVTSSRRFLERGPLRQSLLDTWCLVRYLVLGATAEDVARMYRSSRERAG
jgi:rSAM/selenodomain-associated transferase 2